LADVRLRQSIGLAKICRRLADDREKSLTAGVRWMKMFVRR
jgi:hypothetical protein